MEKELIRDETIDVDLFVNKTPYCKIALNALNGNDPPLTKKTHQNIANVPITPNTFKRDWRCGRLQNICKTDVRGEGFLCPVMA